MFFPRGKRVSRIHGVCEENPLCAMTAELFVEGRGLLIEGFSCGMGLPLITIHPHPVAGTALNQTANLICKDLVSVKHEHFI